MVSLEEKPMSQQIIVQNAIFRNYLAMITWEFHYTLRPAFTLTINDYY
jgi:hypothetical protein